ncbi:MAG: Crp/Fnr family transcriptional regulator [Actinomycetota bacterium]|nr:Crp/Fnr family transcriptional regulator [Acidimicrobiaceae bacterium]MEC7366636.1 Crp/Fnr family transcriptional regulator [Actinomycetota bacterium]MEC7577702.1 Crp/Fnr family transcriptional regulator [Actinomycetota bacterium]MEC8119285.1 Crp/Fnr family transcriptional regulator [Actinomycetota bacterium]MEC8393197.1 Crp/Fnr family transcriptional regulator [Actinomycetota bacterium]
MTTADFLRSIDMFSELDDTLLEPIVAQSKTLDLQRGDVLFQSGDDSSDLYIVTRGRIAIGNRSFDGRESLVALMESGDLFGEMPLFSNDGRSAEARALEESAVVVIPYQPVKDLYDENPSLLWRVVEMLVSRLKSTDIALADTMFLDVTGRTAKRLLEMAGESDEFQLPITQEELAGMIGASRERVNKSISSFIKLGWLSQSGEKYIILDRKQLEIRST